MSVEQQNERLQNEIARLQQEVRRQQALYRTMQRALGVPRLLPATAAKAALAHGGKKVKRRRRTTRGDRVLAALSKASTPEDVGGET